MISIRNLTKKYQSASGVITAVDDISLEVEKGDIFGIIGLSGAGKSSLIRSVNRLEEPTSGEIFINSVNIMNLNNRQLMDARRKMGMIFQHFSLLNTRTVYQNIAFPLELLNEPKKTIDKRVCELLELVELTEKKHEYPSSLSGGQKQRVAIARALANSPDVLLCDEATSALDPKTTSSILNLLQKINKKMGLTILLITHEMDVIKQICNKVMILENGKAIEQGSTVDIFSKASTSATRHFIDQKSGMDQNWVIGADISSNRMYELTFMGDSARRSIISEISRSFDVDINILCGNIEYIQNSPIGKLVVEIDAADKRLEDIIDFLENQNIIVKEQINGQTN